MARASKRAVLLAALLILAAIALPPFINVNRYRLDAANAMGRALGRQVTVGGISMRLFPQPGFNLENVVIADDPAINAEPLLRAGEVTASLRLSSLWRGRLEIAKLSLTDPSLNLARAPDGRWNLQSLLYRVAQTPSAPTAKARPESRPRFPYIEAEGGRINLKLGVEKTVWALTDADFALWLASENRWELRLKGRPVRTDANLGDTGTVSVEGSLQRADKLSETPLSLRVRMQQAQLGQVTQLIYGRDRGWRGTVQLDAQLLGTPDSMKVTANAAVNDFRRYDIFGGGAMRLAASCASDVSLTRQQATSIECDAPVGGGSVSLRGYMDGFEVRRSYDLSVAAENLPVPAVTALLRHMKQSLPQDLYAAGSVDAAFSLRRAPGQDRDWTGGGLASAVELRSAQLQEPLAIGNVRFTLETAGGGLLPRGIAPPTLVVRPFPVDLGAAAPATAQALFSGTGYLLQLHGESTLPRLLNLAHAAGIAAPQTVASGSARVDLGVTGGWTGFAAPKVLGTATLLRASARLPGFSRPLEIAAARISLTAAETRVDNLSASFAGTPSTITGTLSLPRQCALASCPVNFQLRADELSSDDLDLLLNPRRRSRPWYALIGLSSGPQESPLSHLNAQGQISIGKLAVKTLVANHLTADVSIVNRAVAVTNLAADVLGGRHLGEWHADFSGPAPSYTGHGSVEGVALARLATLMHDDWATGKASATYRAAASGWTSAELAKTAEGAVSFDWRDGALARVALGEGRGPLRIHRFAGQLQLRAGILEFVASRMETPDGIYAVSGTASLDQQLGLRLARNGSAAFEVTGTVAKPRVTAVAVSAAQAAMTTP